MNKITQEMKWVNLHLKMKQKEDIANWDNTRKFWKIPSKVLWINISAVEY